MLLHTGPPVLECTVPPPPINVTELFSIRDVEIGCDLCIEPGEVVEIASIFCKPRTSRVPTDCTMTTPNGTNVLDIFDPFGAYFYGQTFGVGLVFTLSQAANPDSQPLGFDVLGNWTCQCNNSDGHVVAYSKFGSCCE